MSAWSLAERCAPAPRLASTAGPPTCLLWDGEPDDALPTLARRLGVEVGVLPRAAPRMHRVDCVVDWLEQACMEGVVGCAGSAASVEPGVIDAVQSRLPGWLWLVEHAGPSSLAGLKSAARALRCSVAEPEDVALVGPCTRQPGEALLRVMLWLTRPPERAVALPLVLSEPCDPADRTAVLAAGVFLLHPVAGFGVVPWGDRTLGVGEAARCSVRLSLCMVRSRLRDVVEPLLFELRGPALSAVLRRVCDDALVDLWRQGWLGGDVAEEAYVWERLHEDTAGRLHVALRVRPRRVVESVAVTLTWVVV